MQKPHESKLPWICTHPGDRQSAVRSWNSAYKGSCGDIVCKSGEVTVVKEEDFVGEGLFSPDTVNGKCLFLAEDLDL